MILVENAVGVMVALSSILIDGSFVSNKRIGSDNDLKESLILILKLMILESTPCYTQLIYHDYYNVSTV